MAVKIRTITIERLDFYDDYNYFTVRNGKAKYHLLHLPDHSCGLYYALRQTDEGLAGRRALEPETEITLWKDE